MGSTSKTGSSSTHPDPRPSNRRPVLSFEETTLLAAALDGDAVAVGTIYDLHAAPLYRVARCLLGSSSGAERVVVNVLVRACTSPGVVRPDGGSLRVALLGLTQRECRDNRRGPGRV